MRRMLPGVVFLMTMWTAVSGSGPVHDNFLFIANAINNIIYQVDLDRGGLHVIKTEGESMLGTSTVGYDPVEERVYWSNVAARTIYSSDLDGTDAVELVSEVDARGLVIDHISRLLFYADWDERRISKVPLGGGNSTTFIQFTSGPWLYDIKLDIKLGYIYWTDGSKAIIERADLTGNDRQVVVSPGGDIEGMAISDKDLCWCDLHVKVECVGRNGANRRVIYDGTCKRIAMSETHVYIIDYSGALKCSIAVVDLLTLEVEYISTADSCTTGNSGIHIYTSNGTVTKSTRSPSAITSEPGTSPELTHELGTSRENTSEPGTPSEITSRPPSKTSTNAPRSRAGSKTPSALPSVDPCTKDRGGCGQYCSSSGPQVTCVCSNSFVLSLLDNKTCEDPCSENNGGCSQVCSVENHEIVCRCHEGFVVDPVDKGKYSEVDECTDVTCGNGGTCVDLINQFFCRCTGDWRGIFCMQKLIFEPVVRQVQPTVGAVAGRTRITLDGEHLIPGVLVRLGPDHQCSYDSSTDNQAVVYTPPVDDSLAGTTLPISIEFPGFQRVDTQFSFTYMKNPTLQSVAPLVSSAVGGTRLTVRGENLHIISDPEILVTMVHSYLANSSPQETTQQYTGICDNISIDKMFCQTPRVDIPEAFESWEENIVGLSGAQSTTIPSFTKYPVHQENDLTLVTTNQSLDFYIGFKLDGLGSYKNLSDTLDLYPNGKIAYYTIIPQILMMEFDNFIPYSDARIRIKGKDLTHGFQPSDYEVGIGAGWCTGVEVTDNEIICAPPDELPAEDISQGSRSMDGTDQEKLGTTERTVLVHIGSNLRMNAGVLTYQLPQNSGLNTAAIIAGTLSGLAILALAAVIGAVVLDTARKNAGEQTAGSIDKREKGSHLHQSSPTAHREQAITGDAGSHGHHPPLQRPKPGYPAEGLGNLE